MQKILDLTVHKISHDDFFSYSHDPSARENFERHKELCQNPMNSLIKKYKIFSKKILSIGPGLAFEEYWFWKNSNTLTFISDQEIFSNPKIEDSSKSGDHLTYIIDDARNFREHLDERFDVVFFSGFTPNELSERSVYEKNKPSIVSRGLNLLSRKTKANMSTKRWVWPSNEKPFIDFVMEILESTLAEKGLFIYQSYASNVDINTYNYLQNLKNQIESIGIHLLNAYHFIDAPHVKLIVGYKGDVSDANRFALTIKDEKDIKSFHGRGMNNFDNFKGIKKDFEILDENKN